MAIETLRFRIDSVRIIKFMHIEPIFLELRGIPPSSGEARHLEERKEIQGEMGRALTRRIRVG
jgi:hypothetical protein